MRFEEIFSVPSRRLPTPGGRLRLGCGCIPILVSCDCSAHQMPHPRRSAQAVFRDPEGPQPATPSVSRSDGLIVKSVSQLVSQSASICGQVRSGQSVTHSVNVITSVVSASVNECQSASVRSSTPSGSEAVSYQPPPVSVHASLSLAPSVSPDSIHCQSAQDHVDTRSAHL